MSFTPPYALRRAMEAAVADGSPRTEVWHKLRERQQAIPPFPSPPSGVHFSTAAMSSLSQPKWDLLRSCSLCLVLAAGCDGSGGSATISAQALAGKIGGQAWTFVQGETDAFLSDSSSYFVTLYASSFTACSTFSSPGDEGHLLMSIPTRAGSYDLSLARNATFYVPPYDNLVATRGHVQIDEITVTTITGGASITYDTDNTVDGQFHVDICP